MQIDSERVEFDNNSSQWIFLFFVQTFPGYSLISSYVIQFIFRNECRIQPGLNIFICWLNDLYSVNLAVHRLNIN